MIAGSNATGNTPAIGLCDASSIRDRRVDFIRGAALLLIYSDHISGNLLAEYTLYSVGFADMAEVFVFISGYVGGIAYYRRMSAKGFWSCQKKALYRVGQLYFAHLASVAVLILVLALHQYARSPGGAVVPWYRSVEATPAQSLIDLALLRGYPQHLAILPLYMVLLLVLPSALAAGRRSIAIPVTVSLLLYLAVPVFPRLFGVPRRWEAACFFNPFAWQLLFMTGALLGTSPAAKRFIPRSPLAFFLGVALIQASLLMQIAYPRHLIPLIDKQDMQPLRLVFFFCMLVVGRCLLRGERPAPNFWDSPLARPIVRCGESPLPVFCAGAVLSTLASWLINMHQLGLVAQMLINFAGWLACFAVATVASRARLWLRGEARHAAAVPLHV